MVLRDLPTVSAALGMEGDECHLCSCFYRIRLVYGFTLKSAHSPSVEEEGLLLIGEGMQQSTGFCL